MDAIPRISPKERLILKLLGEHDKMFGLDMVRESDGQLKEGTVYVTLGRMMRNKGVVELAGEDRSGSGPPRKLYRITAHGQRVLAFYEAFEAGHSFQEARA